MRNRNTFNSRKFLKDYGVPLVWGVLILLLIWNYFFGSPTQEVDTSKENQTWIEVQLDSADTEAYISYSGDEYKNQVEWITTMYKWEKIQVKSGTVTLTSPDIGTMKLGKLWELKYTEWWVLQLFSSDLWLSATQPTSIEMKYAKVNVWENTTVNLTQNEATSSVYNLTWFVEVSNLAAKNTILWNSQKVMVLRNNATKEDFDISLAKEEIDDYFKASDWFLKNWGQNVVIEQQNQTGTWSESATGTIQSTQGITFTSIQDEQSVKESSITVSGTVGNEEIAFVSIGGQKVPVRESDKWFDVKNVELSQKTNDLVVKAYNGSGELIWKYPLTVYYEWAATTTTTVGTANLFDVKNYSLDATKFKFLIPKTNPFTTTEKIVTIEGSVPPWTVDKINVNGFTLTQFPSWGTYWKYHANADYGNLKDGLNIYEVKYLAKDGTVLHQNAFTIIKEVPQSETISDEANTWSVTSESDI